MSVTSRDLFTTSPSRSTLYFAAASPPRNSTLVCLPRTSRRELPSLCYFDSLRANRSRLRVFESEGALQVDGVSESSLNFDYVLSVVESLCIVSSAILSIGFVVNCVVSSSTKTVLTVIGSRLFGCGVVALVAGVGIGAWIRKRQWGRISRGSARGRLEVNLLERIEKLEEDLRSYATMIRVMSRQLEKLGIRFRVTRKAIKQPIAETAALAQKNSEATRALAIQEDILEKELGEIQKVLLAMQEQQQKQLELILAIGKTSKLWDTKQERNQEQETTISRKEQDKTEIPKSTAEGLKQKEAHQI
ncbi:hypothetical protein UlMin_038302 [Ulmus minor]